MTSEFPVAASRESAADRLISRKHKCGALTRRRYRESRCLQWIALSVGIATVGVVEGMHHLPRLPRPYYQAFAVVHWTITLEDRAAGWLDARFHNCFRELLLHAAAREGLFCPAYVLMPDHLHLVWMGLKLASDQINAMRFLRKYLQIEFTRRSRSETPPYELQKQSHDTVLREEERKRGAFASACSYIIENPVRAGLVSRAADWQWIGAVVPGYPEVHPLSEDYWPLFWKLYQEHREPRDSPALPRF